MWKILIVDDEKINYDLMMEILKDMATCVYASTGEQALMSYNQSVDTDNRYDAILLDMGMTGLDGLSVLKAIRAKEQNQGVELGSGVPIIIISGHKEPFMDAFNIGCDDYLLKPIESDKLITMLKSRARKRK